jgi:hypothetical protein
MNQLTVYDGNNGPTTSLLQEEKMLPLDMEGMANIERYFMHGEAWIYIVKTALNDLIFKGGMKLDWGRGLISVELGDAETKHAEMLSKTALDWRRMFGFCPVRIKFAKESKRPEFSIPPFGAGMFVYVFKGNTKENGEIRYLPYKSAGRKPNKPKKDRESRQRIFNGNRETPKSTSEVRFPKNYRVFVWPGMEPSLSAPMFKTPIPILMEMQAIVKDMEQDVRDSSGTGARPKLIVQRPTESLDMNEMTMDQVFARDVMEERDPQERRVQKVSKRAHNHMIEQVDRLNSGAQALEYDHHLNRYMYVQKDSAIDPEDIFTLYQGDVLTHQQMPKSEGPTYLEMRTRYEEVVRRTMGEDMTQQTRQENQQARNSRELQDSVVTGEREAVSLFYAFCWEMGERQQDNANLARLLTDLKEQTKQEKIRLENAESPEQKLIIEGRIRVMKKSKQLLDDISLDVFRVSLKFLSNPFELLPTKEDIQFAVTQNALTAHEQINLSRSLLKLSPLPLHHPLIKDLEKIRELEFKQRKEQLELPVIAEPIKPGSTLPSSKPAPKKQKLDK